MKGSEGGAMKRLSVVQIVRRFVRDEWGGTETVILETSKRLLALGHHTEVLCTNALASQEREVIDGVRVTRTSYFYPYWGLSETARRQLDQKGGNLFSFALMRTLMRLPELDLIHLHTLKRLGGIGRRVARKRRIPYVVSLHGGVHDVPEAEARRLTAPTAGAFEWGKALGWWVASRRVLDDAAAIICVGQEEQRLTQARYPAKRVVYLPNGVEPQHFARGDGSRFRHAHGIPTSARVLLTVGRIDPQKNQMLAVKALQRLRAVDPDTYLVLVGPVTDDAYLEELRRAAAQAGVADAVRIVPGLRPDDPALVDAYHAADVFLLPSVHEPFGIVILEAWAAGLPVLASRVGGVPYFVADGADGILFDPQDEADLVRAYHDLTPDRCRAFAEAGRAKVLREYTWDAVTRRLLQIYQEVLAEHALH